MTVKLSRDVTQRAGAGQARLRWVAKTRDLAASQGHLQMLGHLQAERRLFLAPCPAGHAITRKPADMAQQLVGADAISSCTAAGWHFGP